jgi:hypothetical protein
VVDSRDYWLWVKETMARRQAKKKPNPIASSPKAEEATVENPVPVAVVPMPQTPKQRRVTRKQHQRWTWIGAVAAFFASIAAVGLQLLSYDNAPMTLKIVTGVVMGTAGALAYVNRQLHLNEEAKPTEPKAPNG